MLSLPRAIFFDFGNALLAEECFDAAAGNARLFELAQNPHGVTPAQFRAELSGLIAEIDDRRQESLIEIPIFALNRLFYERFAMAFPCGAEQAAWEFWSHACRFSPMPHVRETLAAFAHLPLGIISNTIAPASFLERQLARFGLDQYFRLIITSCEYGLRKPHPAIFLTAAARLNVLPAEAWFVGDSPVHDIAGAQAAGLQAIWLNPAQKELPTAMSAPSLEISSLDTLLRHLPQ